jgi:ribonuclease HII
MITATTQFEQKYWDQGLDLICGIDEVGRGCFAGPVVAAAVVFSKSAVLPEGIADSKLLTPAKREELSKLIKKVALDYAIVEVGVDVINKVGIGKATQTAFVQSVRSLRKAPEFILIDAFYITELDKSIQHPIKKGDQLSVSIAAASIIAKVHRDELMTKLDVVYPQFGFAKHKGYGTKGHQIAIKQHGLSDVHRKSFNLTPFL